MPIYPKVTIPELIKTKSENRPKKKTLLWDFETGEVAKTPDGNLIVHGGHPGLSTCDCVANFVRKVLATPRGEAAIYPFSYGADLYQLIGQLPDYVETRAPSMLAESLAALNAFEKVDVDSIEFSDNSIILGVTLHRRDDVLLGIQNIPIGAG